MIDQAIIEFDKALRTVFAQARSVRPVPGGELPDAPLTDEEREHVAALMRVNHCGEICAQALYQGQAMMSRDESVRRELQQASNEETEHLAWTEQRIAELGGRKSLLNPLWYGGSLALGLLAGKLGDRWNLGFLAETERQVEAHLNGHLGQLPAEDRKSREILEQMKADEARHADTAVGLGAHELPTPFKAAMKLISRVMTTTAFRV
ncbi:2-polyprenyl-3-methyl-6-methoxy-1,4-benzoquinone monooxygenase [Aromatoleum diolicum]|uniref:3-demethoxyubiquinol 3-hydroxylase n=1 Tax=Aromatoleum diolicum TaxID=75796 RepID=A0ABX1QGH6_9RHOO|nr:2-polyprenyl-3-methyl-6-methoxy-1,4-benzoquinone monooxygenase [Aromatoleum diolicum]NMG76516.1 2-polyprenyl-3-methyl-6-methoxy-1,4-benzoquinone monooxygenase [Aromatoleum diolicum]